MIKWEGKEIPFLYLFLYKYLKDYSYNKIYISYSDAQEVFGRVLQQVPKYNRLFVLKEMEEIGLLIRIGNKKRFGYKFAEGNIEKFLNNYNPLF